MKILIKPLSVNKAYRGRRFSTPDLLQFKKDLSFLLPKLKIEAGKTLEAHYYFGVSSSSDLDNCIKTFQDCISEQYGFNDKLIHKITAEKVVVKKGEEFIDFSIGLYFSKTKR